jgi:hypothetical protein
MVAESNYVVLTLRSITALFLFRLLKIGLCRSYMGSGQVSSGALVW